MIGNGLQFSTQTGYIEGTPTATADALIYTITAINSAATDAITVTITVNPFAPNISADFDSIVATQGVAIDPITITSTGGAVDSYSISPMIGNGLQFSTQTGSIEGTPTATADALIYTITATNLTATDTTTVTITVLPTPEQPTLVAQSGETSDVEVSWSNVSGSSYYEIYRGTTDNRVASMRIAQPSTNIPFIDIDTKLSADTTYYYWIRACTNNICSNYSDVASVATLVILSRGTGILNDSGIIVTGNYPTGAGASTVCDDSGVQDCNQGRDAVAIAQRLSKIGGGHGGFDFTKLGADGTPLAIQDGTWSESGDEAAGTKWPCVKDNVTNLIWEVKTNGGTHDKNTGYRWGGMGADPYGTEFYDDWDTLINASNGDTLCGLNNWRVPNREELLSIVNYSRSNALVDTDYFPNVNNTLDEDLYWSTSASSSNENAWHIRFDTGGFVSNNGERSDSYKVRLVSGE